ncbi:MAG: hypothetical protein AB7O56_12875 [Bauldia sp.]
MAAVSWVGAGRHRRAEFDLRAMSPYLKRDIGLRDGDLGGLMGRD